MSNAMNTAAARPSITRFGATGGAAPSPKRLRVVLRLNFGTPEELPITDLEGLRAKLQAGCVIHPDDAEVYRHLTNAVEHGDGEAVARIANTLGIKALRVWFHGERLRLLQQRVTAAGGCPVIGPGDKVPGRAPYVPKEGEAVRLKPTVRPVAPAPQPIRLKANAAEAIHQRMLVAAQQADEAAFDRVLSDLDLVLEGGLFELRFAPDSPEAERVRRRVKEMRLKVKFTFKARGFTGVWGTRKKAPRR
jgi:hypothetical protein